MNRLPGSSKTMHIWGLSDQLLFPQKGGKNQRGSLSWDLLVRLTICISCPSGIKCILRSDYLINLEIYWRKTSFAILSQI